ncbi:hypothetical protein, variant [Puccinia striiformis f. sp. tritici PST-78]|uniref:Uncharacterized protein n=1 Tax=Puccinia striiformis f. sp. tritici PST-78 TaxID=1165861 RepID=A0A0L0W4R7_9BASI|nr:hypothetical protein PSTG_00351 [Puccinia striiformis f. sp. tritici PST-78]KNF06474.1 hypothetical protein, variant [Puccinia striiformis f. sp. tritici PST-78]
MALSSSVGVPRARPSSFATEKLKPLTQLSTSEALLRSDVIGHSIENNLTQSEHSRRGSMSSQSHYGSNASNNHVNNLHGLPTTQASIPRLTLGARPRQNEGVDQEEVTSNGPHPYDLILPGEEIRKIPNKTRTMSAATAPATSTASRDRSKSFHRVGARRFTQTAHTSVRFDSDTGANIKSSLHGRRYSTIVREPSAATVPRGSNGTEDVFEEDDHPQDAKRLARHDTQMLLVSFNSLLGRDGGGKAVEQLIAFILQGGMSKVVEEVTALVKHVLRDVPTLQAAYVSVYMHEITEQIQKIGGLLFLEPELLSIFENIYSRFGGVANTKATGCQELSFSSIWQILVDKLTTSPVYQSALLKVIETFCKLLLSSEQLRDGLWTSFSQAFSQAQRSPADDTTANVTACLSLVFAAVEQLTGCSVGPFVKYFISWLAIVDDLLTKLALETSAVMNQPLSLPMGPPTDYATHPFGYVYSPTESSAKLEVVTHKWLTVFREDPVHKSAFEHCKRCFENVISGIMGNSTFARFSRDLVRVWRGVMGHPSEGVVGTGLEGGLECFKNLASQFIEIPVENIITLHKGFELTLSDFNLCFVDALPLEISFSTHSRLITSNCSFQNSTRLELKDLQLGLKNPCSVHLKDGNSGSTYQSTATLHTKLNLSIDFIPHDNKFPKMLTALPYYGGSLVNVSTSDTKLSGATDLNVPDTLWLEVKNQMHRIIETAVQNYVDFFFKTWFSIQPSTPKDLPVERPLSKSANAKSVKSFSSHSHKLPETHGNARDRFKASIRNLTGIKTGSVLTQLQNPLSTAGSPLASPSAEETPGLKSKRRQSMADYLTDISKADSTLPENIQRPPVAEPQRRNTYLANLPNVFDEDEEDAPAEFETMARSLSFSNRGDTTSVDKILRPLVSSKADVNSVFSHRGSMPNFPMVEMSYEAYERAEASLDGQSNTPTMEIAGQEIPSMAQSLSELATRDTTIEEAIAHPPAVDSSESYVESTDIRTMDQITRHLSGVADLPIQDTDVTPEQRILRRNATPPELSSKVVMANALTDSVMEDNTLPETQATGHLSGPVDAAGVPIGGGITSLSENEMVAMRNKLSAMAATDMTLSSNIALPPGAQHVYRGAPINGYTGLKVLRSMSTTLNEAIEKDYTTPEAQAELYRMKQPPIKDQIIGLTEQEMRQRRQSFKLTAEAMKDTTLIESIRNPPIVAKSIPPV